MSRINRTERERQIAAQERAALVEQLPDTFTSLDALNIWGIGDHKTTCGLRKLVNHGDIRCLDSVSRPMIYAKSSAAGITPSAEVLTHLVCRTCGERKPVAAFTRRKESRNGYLLDCKACLREKYQDQCAGKGQPEREKGGRDYDIRREHTPQGTVIVRFGDKARMQPAGEHRSTVGPGVQSSMSMFGTAD